ncbi:hypothetical protein [Streptomyces sp. NPDC051997]|uniref:hypothetical protein n=1 Tax=Streptomyces sp. NPDC051997 TaxID=3155611 RepID=UPI003427E701
MTTSQPAALVSEKPRRALLLSAVQAKRGEWTTGRVKRFYRKHLPTHVLRVTMRRDLAALHADGHLVLHDTPNRRFYTLATRKDSR